MDQDVSESCDGAPVNLGMKRLQRVADPLGGFGKGLEVAQNSVLNQFRCAKSLLTVLAIQINAADAVQNVMDVKAIVPHKGIAS
jgi:hypothetical protein